MAGSAPSPKTLLVLLLCVMTLTAPALPTASAQISCRQVISYLTPCVSYLLNGGAVPPNCCSGVTTLYGQATTTASRQSICRCLRSALNGVSYNNQNVKNAQALPAKCRLRVPYNITPQTKCEQIP
uniref:Non-specific lipid-transfer protein n=1 Tax=Kalanchoe fedtschenkoi TaxID=63787 RepID=A0A7N0VHJ2_KALFE